VCGSGRRRSHTPRASAAGPDGDPAAGVRAAWVEALGLADVPTDANFFDLGGDSLNMFDLRTHSRGTPGSGRPWWRCSDTPPSPRRPSSSAMAATGPTGARQPPPHGANQAAASRTDHHRSVAAGIVRQHRGRTIVAEPAHDLGGPGTVRRLEKSGHDTARGGDRLVGAPTQNRRRRCAAPIARSLSIFSGPVDIRIVIAPISGR
jgi:hypothetical protein